MLACLGVSHPPPRLLVEGRRLPSWRGALAGVGAVECEDLGVAHSPLCLLVKRRRLPLPSRLLGRLYFCGPLLLQRSALASIARGALEPWCSVCRAAPRWRSCTRLWKVLSHVRINCRLARILACIILLLQAQLALKSLLLVHLVTPGWLRTGMVLLTRVGWKGCLRRWHIWKSSGRSSSRRRSSK